MIEDIAKLVDKYAIWVRDKSQLKDLGNDFVELTTPYLDRHNDYLQIYIRKENNLYLLSDGGYTIEDLKASGCILDSRKRQDLLNQTLRGFGVQIDNGILLVKATADNFPLKKHNLLQAILGVNDLFYLSEPHVMSLFIEDVASWLSANDIRYTPKVKFTGKSGYDHSFDFVIPSSKKQPERLIRAVAKPTRDLAEALAFSWIDTKEIRAVNSRFYGFLNDSEMQPQVSIVEALESYEITPVLWSARDMRLEELVN
jgi:hypothetical protein